MKQNKLITLFSLVALGMTGMGMTGCAIDRDGDQGEGTDMVVRFKVDRANKAGADTEAMNTGIGIGTKVTGENFDPGDEISVFAPPAGMAIYSEYAAKDRRYVADGYNNFICKPGHEIRYASKEQKLDFHVFYPAVGGDGEEIDVSNMAAYTVTLADITDQTGGGGGGGGRVVPYMFAKEEGKGLSDGTVPLKFKYVMSKIKIYVTYDTEAFTGLNDIAFYAEGGLKAGVLIDLKQGNYATMTKTSGAVAVSESNPIRLTPAGMGVETVAYIPPGTVTRPVIKMEFEKPGGGAAEVYYARINAGTYTYEAGKEYTYNVKVGVEEELVTFGNVSIADWEPVTAPTIPAEH